MEEDPFKVSEFVAHSTRVNCLTIGPHSAQVMATGGEDCKVNIWRVDNSANIWSLGQNKSPIECLGFDAEEQYIVSGAMNGSLKVFDLNEGKLARNLRGHQTTVTSLHYHPYGEFVVSGSIDNTMKVWDVRSKMCIQTYTGHEKEVTCVRFSPDGRWVASSGKDGQFLVWDLVAGKLVQCIKTKNNYLNSFEFNPAEFLLAGASSDRTVKFWDLETFERIGRTPPDPLPVTSVAFNGDGSYLCSASKKSLRVWGWDPAVEARASVNVGWENVYEMRIAPNTKQVVGGSFISNFVSTFSVSLDDLLEDGDDEEDSLSTDDIQSKPTHSEAPQECKPSAELKGSADDSIDKSDFEDDYENDFEDDLKLDVQDLGEVDAKDSKAGSGGLGVEWDSGITPRDLAASMGESFLAKLKEDERRARANGGQSSPRVRPPSTAQRHRNPPRRPTDSAAPKAKESRNAPNLPAKKAVSSRNSGVDNGNPDFEGLAIVGSRQGSRDSSDSSRVAPGGYRYANDVTPEADRKSVLSSRGSSPRREECKSAETPRNYLRPTESSSTPKDRNSEELMDKLLAQNNEIIATLSQRLTNLRLLKQYWERGDISTIVDHLKTIQMTCVHDPNGSIVLADFFSSVDLCGSGIVSLDVCGKILPVLDDMLEAKADEVLSASLMAITALADTFGPLIGETRSVIGRAVDISREERIEKCNKCHVVFCQIQEKCDVLRSKHRKNSSLRSAIDKVLSLISSMG